MWFEILPGAAIITVALSVPIYAMYGLQKLTMGNAYRRNMDERFSRVMYQRDFRLTNNPYIMNGLDEVPDEDQNEKKNDQGANN
ncbi:NADH dehydrogenase [ubiquinone] 1 alpha subcomplex subunit 1 isoform X1 [Drosophila sulfurigaster albostrigata]|uniref:NADH dehydrogenase [ubiquinone] 1 alpha subcomplex subunit 1 isoform X1 n=1 Tax=Drosophila sulfurigaster albostrigata TaxID=89887 RepID=UPI002D21BC8B|nr:NADH dehydrogenase [ubiquinone] 1 alpha subcomplex subunit 1 isoform X1 [Drosophila sulfurigaster albostrigata]